MNNRRPRVYIPNKSGHDYSSATRFGDLVFITTGTVDKFNMDKYASDAMLAMTDAIGDDYILLASLTSLCCICTAIMARRFGRVNFLIYRRDRYIERSLSIDHLGKDE